MGCGVKCDMILSMINFIIICLGIILAIILLQTGVLYILGKLFKIQNISFLRCLLIISTLLILGGLLSVIFRMFLPILLAEIIVIFLSYFIFSYFIKKSDILISVGKKISLFISFLILGTIASFAFAIIIRLNVAEPFLVAGDAMAPTYIDKDYLVLSKMNDSYQRGDVVVFKFNGKFLIKRIIGLPGETVEIKNDIITICKPDCQTDMNKLILNEPYIIKMSPGLPQRPDSIAKVKQDEYYLLGDNRPVSSDSRIYGPIKAIDIVGLIKFQVFNIGQ